ncbi:MAG: GumC family protein, partial [Acidobacteriota bacterium]
MSEPFDSSRRGLPAYPTQPMQVMPPMPALPDLPPAPGDDGLEIRKYLNGLRRRWPLVLACLVIASTYALIRYSLTTKEYMSTTIIQIERKRLSLVALGQAGWLEDWWNLEYYPTQYRLLRSRGMAERVVHNLRLYENPAFTGRPAEPPSEDGEVETPTSEIEVARLAAQVQGGLDVKPIRETQLVEISFRSTVPELAAQIADAYAHAFIEWGIETRSTTVGQAASYISDQINTLNQEIEDRQKLLDSLAGDSEFGLDPEGGALIERQNTLEVQHNKVLSERIGLEAAYNGILSLAEETVANTSSGGRVSELKSELFLLESDYQTKLSTFLPTWPEMVDRKKEIEDKRGQLERLISEKYNEAKDRAYSELQKARREEQSLEDELRRLNADARLKNSSAIEYANHKTYIEHRKELRDDLLKRQSETEMASRTQTTQESNVSIVDSAIIPTQPFRPSLRSGLTQALFVGLLLGFGGIFLLEVMDRTIKSPEELESILGYPTLAVVPDMAEEGKGSGIMGRYIKGAYGYGYGYGYSYGGRSGAGSKRLGRERKKKTADGNEPKREIELLPHKNPKLAVCEAYRSLRTALLLSSAEELRIVAVT